MIPEPQDPLTLAHILHLLGAARDGLAEARFVLGLIHEYGLGGLPADLPSALRWYRAAACLSPREPSCCGRRVRDPSSEELHAIALAPVFRAAYLHAQRRDEYARSFGQDVLNQRFRWYARADVAIDGRAEFAVARHLCMLSGAPSPEPWFRRAAEAGLPEAQVQLGLLLSSQADAALPADRARLLRSSRTFFESARLGMQRLARRGNREAWYQLGVLLLEGWGGARDPEAGFFWLARAAAAGHPESKEQIQLRTGRSDPRMPVGPGREEAALHPLGEVRPLPSNA